MLFGENLEITLKIFIPIPGTIMNLFLNIFFTVYFATFSELSEYRLKLTPATLLKFVLTGPRTKHAYFNI